MHAEPLHPTQSLAAVSMGSGRLVFSTGQAPATCGAQTWTRAAAVGTGSREHARCRRCRRPQQSRSHGSTCGQRSPDVCGGCQHPIAQQLGGHVSDGAIALCVGHAVGQPADAKVGDLQAPGLRAAQCSGGHDGQGAPAGAVTRCCTTPPNCIYALLSYLLVPLASHVHGWAWQHCLTARRTTTGAHPHQHMSQPQ